MNRLLRTTVSLVALAAVALAAIGCASPEPPRDPHLAAALAQRDATGRDNAMIRYYQAKQLVPGYLTSMEDLNLIADVAEDGWREEAERLLPTIRQWQPVFDLIHEGAALDYAEGVGGDRGSDSLMPDFMFSYATVRAMAFQARYHESRGEHDAALDNLVAMLRFARDHGAEGNTVIGTMYSIALQNNVLRTLRPIVAGGQLDAEQLQRVQRELAHIAATEGGLAAGLRGERRMNADILADRVRQAWESDEAALEALRLEYRNPYDESAFAGQEMSEFARELVALVEEIGREIEAAHERALEITQGQGLAELFEDHARVLDTAYELAIEHAPREPHEHDHAAVQARIRQIADESDNPLMRLERLPDYSELMVRHWTMVARRRLVQTQAALELYRLEHGRYPESLEALGELPTDPFSGEAFRYRAEDDGAAYDLYSLGPDKLDNPDVGEYDPTNGTTSAGVIR